MNKVITFAVVLLFLAMDSYGQVRVTPDRSALALAQKLTGQGVVISDPVLQCAGRANGFFNVVSSGLGLDSGIVLTNGRAATQSGQYGVNGPSLYFASNNNNMPGDPMLTPLANHPTYDACVLEFDVVPGGDTIRFNYVFSSEEYISAVCGQYNDVFAFFISGPGIAAYDNMALVPGTDIPVTINTINNGIPGPTGNIANCTSMGPGAPFTGYYTDNSAGNTLTHQGLTKVMQAKHAVTPCGKYHLKLAIADAGNATYDSGVFLEAGSLSANSYSIKAVNREGSDKNVAYCVRGCAPATLRIKSRETSSWPQTIRLITGGNAINGIDYTSFPDSVVIPANSLSAEVVINALPAATSAIKTLRVLIRYDIPCTGNYEIVDSAAVVIYDTLHTTTENRVQCANDSIKVLLHGEDIYTYNWVPGTGLSDASAREPVAFPAASIIYTVSISLPGTLCTVKEQEVNIRVKLTPAVSFMSDTTVCGNTILALVAVLAVPNDYYSYRWSGPSGIIATVPDTSILMAGTADAGTYTIKVTVDTNGCSAIAAANVDVTVPALPVVVQPSLYCKGYPGRELQAVGEGLLWYVPSSILPLALPPVPDTREVSDHKYYVTRMEGACESAKAEIAVSVKECCKSTIAIPNAFTPNGDGRNDVFRVLSGYGYAVEWFRIFDRWGQIVYTGLDGVWDGANHGAPADVGTYYYSIALKCIVGGSSEVRQGDITLIR